MTVAPSRPSSPRAHALNGIKSQVVAMDREPPGMSKNIEYTPRADGWWFRGRQIEVPGTEPTCAPNVVRPLPDNRHYDRGRSDGNDSSEPYTPHPLQ